MHPSCDSIVSSLPRNICAYSHIYLKESLTGKCFSWVGLGKWRRHEFDS